MEILSETFVRLRQLENLKHLQTVTEVNLNKQNLLSTTKIHDTMVVALILHHYKSVENIFICPKGFTFHICFLLRVAKLS